MALPKDATGLPNSFHMSPCAASVHWTPDCACARPDTVIRHLHPSAQPPEEEGAAGGPIIQMRQGRHRGCSHSGRARMDPRQSAPGARAPNHHSPLSLPLIYISCSSSSSSEVLLCSPVTPLSPFFSLSSPAHCLIDTDSHSHAQTHTHTQAHTHTLSHSHTHTLTCTYTHTFTLTFSHSHRLTCTYTYIHSHSHILTHTHTHTDSHTLSHTHSRTHTHALTHALGAAHPVSHWPPDPAQCGGRREGEMPESPEAPPNQCICDLCQQNGANPQWGTRHKELNTVPRRSEPTLPIPDDDDCFD